MKKHWWLAPSIEKMRLSGKDKLHTNSLFSVPPLPMRNNFIDVDSGDNEKSEFVCSLSLPVYHDF